MFTCVWVRTRAMHISPQRPITVTYNRVHVNGIVMWRHIRTIRMMMSPRAPPNAPEPESPSECPTIRDIRVKTAGSRAQSSAARSPSEASPKPVPHVSAPVPVDDTLGVCRNAVK